MLRNYLKTAWRNLWKNKFYSSINIAGLAIGLAVGLIILLWVKDEKSFDRFHSNQAEIYRVVPELGSGESKQTWAQVPAPIAIYARQSIPGIKDAARIAENNKYTFYSWNNNKFRSLSSVYVDNSFFRMFDFKIKAGQKQNPFPDKHSVLITEKTAATIFGKEDPVGKVISADNKNNFIVRGVIEDFPSNSSIQTDMLFPMQILEFVLAGFIAILIALLTVSSQAIRAALANPVKSLKTE